MSSKYISWIKQDHISQVLLFLGMLLIGLVAVFLFIYDFNWPLIAILAVALFTWTLVYPKYALVFLIIWNFFQNLVRYLPGFIQNADLLDELLLVALTIRWILPVLAGKRSIRRTPLDIPFLFFLLFYVFSVFINGVPLSHAIFGFRDVFQFVLLFYILVQIDFGQELLLRGINWIFLIAAANFAVLFIQVAVFFARTGILFIEDDATGLMGISGAHKLGYFAGFLLVTYIARYSANLKVRWYWFFILVMIIVFTSPRAVYFAVPISILIVYARQLIKNPRLIKRIAVAGLVFVGFVLVYVNLPITQSATINIKTIYRQQFGTQDAGTLRRVGFLEYSWETLQNNNILIGTGPGTYVSKTPSRLGSSLYTKFQQDFPFDNSFNTGSQISLTIVEYGILGTLLILFVYLVMFLSSYRLSRKSNDPSILFLSYATQGMVVMTMLSMVSINIFELQEVVFVLWYVFGVMIALRPVKTTQ